MSGTSAKFCVFIFTCYLMDCGVCLFSIILVSGYFVSSPGESLFYQICHTIQAFQDQPYPRFTIHLFHVDIACHKKTLSKYLSIIRARKALCVFLERYTMSIVCGFLHDLNKMGRSFIARSGTLSETFNSQYKKTPFFIPSAIPPSFF